MLLSDWYLARQEKRIQAAVEEAKTIGLEQGIEQGLEQGIEQGIEQGLEQGIEQGIEQGLKQGIEQGLEQGLERGKAEAYQQIAAWNERRKAAEARGEPFTEPPPGTSQNGAEN